MSLICRFFGHKWGTIAMSFQNKAWSAESYCTRCGYFYHAPHKRDPQEGPRGQEEGEA